MPEKHLTTPQPEKQITSDSKYPDDLYICPNCDEITRGYPCEYCSYDGGLEDDADSD